MFTDTMIANLSGLASAIASDIAFDRAHGETQDAVMRRLVHAYALRVDAALGKLFDRKARHAATRRAALSV